MRDQGTSILLCRSVQYIKFARLSSPHSAVDKEAKRKIDTPSPACNVGSLGE